MKSLGRTRENERFKGSFSESDREVRRRRRFSGESLKKTKTS